MAESYKPAIFAILGAQYFAILQNISLQKAQKLKKIKMQGR